MEERLDLRFLAGDDEDLPGMQRRTLNVPNRHRLRVKPSGPKFKRCSDRHTSCGEGAWSEPSRPFRGPSAY